MTDKIFLKIKKIKTQGKKFLGKNFVGKIFLNFKKSSQYSTAKNFDFGKMIKNELR